MCLRATGGPNRRPGPNQPGTPAPGGRGTDAPRPPPVRTRFNGTTAPDVGFRARRGSGGVGGRGLGQRREQLEGASQVPTRWARPVGVERNRQVYSKRARQRSSELATKLLIHQQYRKAGLQARFVGATSVSRPRWSGAAPRRSPSHLVASTDAGASSEKPICDLAARQKRRSPLAGRWPAASQRDRNRSYRILLGLDKLRVGLKGLFLDFNCS